MNEQLPEFTSIDLSAERPPAVCRECASNGIEHPTTGIQAVHCQHERMAAWRVGAGPWHTQPDITAEQLIQAVARGVIGAPGKLAVYLTAPRH